MDAATVVDSVDAATATERRRLSSDKVLLAATGADLSTPVVVGVLGTALETWQDTLAGWAETTTNEELAAGFTAGATAVGAAREEFDIDEATSPDPPSFLDFEGLETEFERAGAGLVAAPRIVDGLALQAVSFFVNEAETTRADRCRALRETVNEVGETAISTLDAACIADADWDAVERGAVRTIEASYTAYATVLEEMGLDPKPVC